MLCNTKERKDILQMVIIISINDIVNKLINKVFWSSILYLVLHSFVTFNKTIKQLYKWNAVANRAAFFFSEIKTSLVWYTSMIYFQPQGLIRDDLLFQIL